jgi:hypothetical protein
MSMSLALRPSFSVDLACPSTVALERLYAALGAGPHALRRTRSPGGGGEDTPRAHDHFVLTVADDVQRVWSPWLGVEVSPTDAGATLFARFGPHPSVWTFFAFAYLTLSVVLMFSLCFTAALAMSGGRLWSLAVSAGVVVVMAGLWATAQLGQRRAREQMESLRAALEAAIARCAAEPTASASASAVADPHPITA